MKFITDVSAERFDAFAIACSWNHYSKTSRFPALVKAAFSDHHLLGVEDENGNLLASAVMLFQKTKMSLGKFAYCQYGFNLDIENRALIHFFASHLRSYAQEQGAFFLRLDSNITRLEHKPDGEIVSEGFNHEYVTAILQEEGFMHLGYNYGYSGNWMSRFTYRIDMHKPLAAVLKGIKRCSALQNKNALRDVRVRYGARDELCYLVQAEDMLSQKRGFKPKDLAWFERQWDCYAPFVHYYIVETNFHRAKMNLQKKIAEENEHLAALKDEQKKATIQKQIDALQKEIAEIEQGGYDQDRDVVLGAKFIIMMGENVWNVNMYTIKTLLNFRGAFALHRFAIEDLYKKGAGTYDFEGVSGSFDPHDAYYGLTDFKKSFGGDFLEFLGEFDAVLNPRKYHFWKWWDHVRRALRRRVYAFVYRKKSRDVI